MPPPCTPPHWKPDKPAIWMHWKLGSSLEASIPLIGSLYTLYTGTGLIWGTHLDSLGCIGNSLEAPCTPESKIIALRPPPYSPYSPYSPYYTLHTILSILYSPYSRLRMPPPCTQTLYRDKIRE